MIEYLEILKNVILFNQIAHNDILELISCLNGKVKKYKKGENVIIAGSKISAVGIVLCGIVQIIRDDIDGNSCILANVLEGEIFGEAFVCAEIQHSLVTVTCIKECEILFIDYKKIITTCSSVCAFHTKLIENMLKLIAGKNIMLSQKIEIISKRTTKEKLLAYLILQSDNKQKSFTIPFSRHELANYLCVDRSAMSRELCHMRDEGIIKFNGNRFTLL